MSNSDDSTETSERGKWRKGTILIAADSMLWGVDEKRLSKKNIVKVRPFSGARVTDMNDYLKPLLKKHPSKIILHVGTNDAADRSSRAILDDLLKLKHNIKSALPQSKVIISCPINRNDNGKASLTIRRLNHHLGDLEINCVTNDNIESDCLIEDGLHLNTKGHGKLAMNFIRNFKSTKNN